MSHSQEALEPDMACALLLVLCSLKRNMFSGWNTLFCIFRWTLIRHIGFICNLNECTGGLSIALFFFPHFPCVACWLAWTELNMFSNPEFLNLSNFKMYRFQHLEFPSQHVDWGILRAEVRTSECCWGPETLFWSVALHSSEECVWMNQTSCVVD